MNYDPAVQTAAIARERARLEEKVRIAEVALGIPVHDYSNYPFGALRQRQVCLSAKAIARIPASDYLPQPGVRLGDFLKGQ